VNWRKIDDAAKDGKFHLLAWRVPGLGATLPSWWNKAVGYWNERGGHWDDGNDRDMPEPAYYIVLDDPE
jgi:hypothetical protein